MFEKLTGKSFFKMMNTPEDISYMMYAGVIVNNPQYRMDYKSFVEVLSNKKLMKRLVEQYEEASAMLSQFKTKTENNGNEDSEDNNLTITQIANSLIIQHHVDAHYVMYEMELWEIPELFEMADSVTKTELAEKRLWTFLQVAPQIDTKKIKTPDKLLPFPWEKEEKKKKAEADLEKERARINDIIGKPLPWLMEDSHSQ